MSLLNNIPDCADEEQVKKIIRRAGLEYSDLLHYAISSASMFYCGMLRNRYLSPDWRAHNAAYGYQLNDLARRIRPDLNNPNARTCMEITKIVTDQFEELFGTKSQEMELKEVTDGVTLLPENRA
ncbi:hypothetical protein LT85_p038 (plasmid) [Collimonas arenae]|uniref:Uncharacterized protein n=1 Tax=Collimonas arenae TaxID=279058 RepID=A0A0A1FMN9_9BURK|nr:hypothetical protein [Collimonas arenae]AIY44217.1 hypothetical protein LT85_p038 [Collimonas arenae]